MKKYIMLFSILLLMLTSSESMGKMNFNFGHADEGDNVPFYYTYIGKNVDMVTDTYGEPDIRNYLYGGELYYYDELPVAFGVDATVISALFIYRGGIDKDIFIGASDNEILKSLNLKEEDIKYNEDSTPFILIEKDKLSFYLNFYNDNLNEIMIKRTDSRENR